MKKKILLFGTLLCAMIFMSLPAMTESTLDQSYDVAFNGGGLLNYGAKYVAQTFTAGMDGTLTGVNVAVAAYAPQYPMRVAIHALDNGAPAASALGYALVQPADQSTNMFNLLLTPSPEVTVSAGTQYAIVISFDGAPEGTIQGTWNGNSPGGYPGGYICAGGPPNYQVGQWDCYDSSDSGFRTYVEASTSMLTVEIDIMPGDDLNCINNNGHGVIPVAILTTDTFDAATVDPFSVALDGATAQVKGKSGNAGALEDVDYDGDLDLMVQIEDVDGTYTEGTILATLSGLTDDGTPFEGTDTICIVP